MQARFVVGIDLGTTNSAVAFVDTLKHPDRVTIFPVPQLVAPGEIEARETLPSFRYEPANGEFAPESLRMPWESGEGGREIVGTFARDHGANVPGRLVVSAKSWLSHSGVDRSAPLLPWHGAPEIGKLSPAEASSRYLAHIRAAWNHAHPEHPLEHQDVVITIPASFDEIARELTVNAARQAGLPKIVLLEEPQAAFYAWVIAESETQAKSALQTLEAGRKILVCDIGGGTSDFTLIQVRPAEGGKVSFHRFAVGDHLILGGDNLDLALAHFVEDRLGTKLDPQRWSVLVRRCQKAKETLLGPSAPERLTIHIPASGARLIGGAQQVELTREEACALLIDGFLPTVEANAQPARQSSGFREFGLPYAPDPAITRYLAAFLQAHTPDDLPDVVLFNGGLFESPKMRERMLEVLSAWTGGREWLVLRNERLDLAVAIGAARYGMVRRGVGTRISGGLARSYYIGVGGVAEPMALCLVPAGLEEGQSVELDRTFELLVRQPAEFPLYISSARTTDKPGDVILVDPAQITALPPIRTALRARAEERPTIPVRLHARLTEIGTLEIWCTEVDGARRWKLQFDVRSAKHTEMRAHTGSGEQAGFFDEATVEACRQEIRAAFTGSGRESARAEGLVKQLETVCGLGRLDWPPSLLRALWEELIEHEAGRHRSAIHEARWLNLLGFTLRPGYGFAVDDWRVNRTWRLYERKVVHYRNELCRAEWWILWRRIAGGLNAGQQHTLGSPLVAALKKRESWGSHESAEIWRLLASLELLSVESKTSLGEHLLGSLGSSKVALWALGRLGARAPVYGPLNTVLPPETAEAWMQRLLPVRHHDAAFALMQMARKTNDRYRDISDSSRQAALSALGRLHAPTHFSELVRVGGTLGEAEQELTFGESLPHGLRLA